MRKVAFLALLSLTACGKSGGKQHNGSGSSVAAASADEPTSPPPPPTVKPAGKGDCKTDYAPRPKRDPNPMCKVDGGTFRMGDDNDHMDAKVSPYYIDQFEVTNAQVAHYLNAVRGREACSDRDMQRSTDCIPVQTKADPAQNFCVVRQGSQFSVPDQCARLPFMGITREGARRYCEWAGKKLPTEAQWEFAARHDPKTGSDLIYPWGNEFDGKRARCDHASCPDGPDDSNPVAVGTYDGTNGHSDGTSPWGVHDMLGNAEEAVLGCANDYHPCPGGPCVDPQGEPARPQESCVTLSRGGDSVTNAKMLVIAHRWEAQARVGFRCARN